MMRQRLFDVLQSRQAITQYTAGLDFSDYQRDPMVRDAVERRLGIIGEALSRAAEHDPDLVERVPELREIVGLRNRIIHGYDVVDDRIIWDIVQNELPLLQARVAALLGATDPDLTRQSMLSRPALASQRTTSWVRLDLRHAAAPMHIAPGEEM